MRALDRIVLVVLALGVWALVLSPRVTGAHHYLDDGHSCDISGEGAVDGHAYGTIEDLSYGGDVSINTRRLSVSAYGFFVDCGHS